MSAENSDVSADWFAHAFGALYPILYAHRTVEAAAPEARFAIEQVDLQQGEQALDLCCGNGRHMVHVQARTQALTGLDYSSHLLQLARKQTGGAVPLVRADMRHVPFTEAFDVVFNFFTSFGYFFTREENASVARSVARALKPGGRFFIDYLNAESVRAGLVPESVRQAGDYEIHDVRWIDETKKRVNKTTRVLKGGEEVHTFQESVRLYTPDEFRTLLTENGLMPERVFGDYTGEPLQKDLPRMIVVGRRA